MISFFLKLMLTRFTASRALPACSWHHAQAGPIEHSGLHPATDEAEDARKPLHPGLVGGRHVLSAVGFDGHHCWDMRGQPGGVEEGRAGTGQVLNAEKHVE